jgi:hypothetical protein
LLRHLDERVVESYRTTASAHIHDIAEEPTP